MILGHITNSSYHWEKLYKIDKVCKQPFDVIGKQPGQAGARKHTKISPHSLLGLPQKVNQSHFREMKAKVAWYGQSNWGTETRLWSLGFLWWQKLGAKSTRTRKPRVNEPRTIGHFLLWASWHSYIVYVWAETPKKQVKSSIWKVKNLRKSFGCLVTKRLLIKFRTGYGSKKKERNTGREGGREEGRFSGNT